MLENEENLIEAPRYSLLMELMNDDRLTMGQRTFLRLKYEENLTKAQIAQRMDIPVNNIDEFERMTFRHIRAFRDPIIEGAFDDEETE